MDPVLTAVLGSMHADMAGMDSVAMNIANAQTTGYKREMVLATPFAARLEAKLLAVHVDQKPGTLKPTGHGLDFALAGPGWFEVSTPQGAAYTRQGDFRLDAAGRLVTQRGQAVMGVGGEIQLSSGLPVADEAGRLFDRSVGARGGAAPIAQLKVVQFEAGASLQRLGDGLVQVQGTPSVVADGAAQVRQGFLENSNVSHTQEMVRLLETFRHFETMQKVALGYDEMLGASIRKLGDAT